MHLSSWWLNFPAETEPITWGYFYCLCSVSLRSGENCLLFVSHSREFIVFSVPQAAMKVNQNVTENKHKTWPCSTLMLFFVISKIGEGVPLVVVLQCCIMFAVTRRIVRMSLWATGEGKTMITCTGSTCPACTAVAAASAARPPSLPQPTPSATHRSPSTCKSPLLKTTMDFNGKLH